MLWAIAEYERERLEHCCHCTDSFCSQPHLHWMTLQNVLEQAREGNKEWNGGMQAASAQVVSSFLGMSLKILQMYMPGYVGGTKHTTTAHLRTPLHGETFAADSTGSTQA